MPPPHKSLILLFILVLHPVSLNSAPMPETVRFAIIGDRTGGHTPGVYSDIILEIELLKPDFTMTVGDMIEGYSGDTSEVRREWEEYQTLITPLTNPIHHTPGNHDIWGDIGDPSIKLYHQFVGPNHYSFDYKGIHIIVLDNSRWDKPEDLPQDQIDWLLTDLQANKGAAWTMVFFHKPFWFETVSLGKPDKLHDIFKQHGVDAVFTGHFHTYFSGEYDGIVYTSLGSSGGATQPGVTGLMYHFAWVTVDSTNLSIALVKKGSVLPWDEVTAADLHTINDLQMTAIKFPIPVKVGSDGMIPTTKVTVNLNNVAKNHTLNDTLFWDVPAGWTVEPKFMPVMMAASSHKSVEFSVSNTGILFPTPKVSLTFPYREGRDGYDIENFLQVQRSVSCVLAKKAPKIDGIIDDKAVWKAGEDKFYGPKGGVSGVDLVVFNFAYDKKNLYLAATCTETDMGKMVASQTDRDGAVYGEDCVGWFLVPPQSGEQTFNYQLYINPNGVIFDQKITVTNGTVTEANRDWNGKYEVKATKSGDMWSIEAKIPLKELGVDKVKSGDEWKINFRRKQKRLDTSADWQVPINYDPATYGVMVLE